LENYKLKDSPLYFALANDGKSSFSTYCPANAVSCVDDGGYFAVDECSRKAKKRSLECSIFAIGKKSSGRAKQLIPINQQIIWSLFKLLASKVLEGLPLVEAQ
jgi:hypothetical protein